MSDITDPNSWVARAEEDYQMAHLALREKTPLTIRPLMKRGMQRRLRALCGAVRAGNWGSIDYLN